MENTSKYYRNQRREIAPFLPTGAARVLEVGCGEGAFSINLPGAEEYWGIELATAAAELAARQLDKVLQGSYADCADALPDGHFDLVVCNDVVEHMADPDGFLRSILTKLKAQGCLVGSIPNVRYLSNLSELLLRRDWHYVDEGILDRTHLKFFTCKSLKRTLLEHGFVVEQLAGINPGFPRAGWRRGLTDRAMVALLGDDVRYLQFGFRARAPAESRAPSGVQPTKPTEAIRTPGMAYGNRSALPTGRSSV